MDRCQICDRPVDTDYDAECYENDGVCYCKQCRELEAVNVTLGESEADQPTEPTALSGEEASARSSPIPPDS